MNRNLAFIVLLAGLILVGTKLAFANSEDLAELNIIHQAREKNHLAPLKYSPALEKAAESHSRYLAYNGTCSHYEDQMHPFFSGYSALERAVDTFYPVRNVSENISCNSGNNHSWKQSAKGLMAAIYHRLAFLDYEMDEIGLSYAKGKAEDALPQKFTYVMGNSYLSALCRSARSSSDIITSPGYYFIKGLCYRLDTKVSVEDYHEAKDKLSQTAPQVVTYPWPGQKNVPPAFLDDETPDPTPTMTLSGMPISAQFNTLLLKQVKVLSFILQDVFGASVEVWQLDATNDVNKKMSSHEFAWFPVRPLKRGTVYHAALKYTADGQEYNKLWSFTTEPNHYKYLQSVGENKATVFFPKAEKVAVRWQSNITDVIEKLSCWCNTCSPKVESFDTISLITTSNNIKCIFKDRAGNQLTFFVKSS